MASSKPVTPDTRTFISDPFELKRQKDLQSRLSTLLDKLKGPTVFLCDLDDTLALDEGVAMNEKLQTATLGREALATLLRAGMPVHLVSSRTSPELDVYRRLLGVQGHNVAEDGGVIALSPLLTGDQNKRLEVAGFRLIEYGARKAVVLSRTTSAQVQALLEEVEQETMTPIVSSVKTSIPELFAAVGHGSIEETIASADHLVSAYAKGLTVEQFAIAKKLCAKRSMRIVHCQSDEVYIFFGSAIDKGVALEQLLKIEECLSGTKSTPIFCGNGNNDVPAMVCALRHNGKAVLVPRQDGSFSVPEKRIPPGTIRVACGPGAGVTEGLERALTELLEEFQGIPLGFDAAA